MGITTKIGAAALALSCAACGSSAARSGPSDGASPQDALTDAPLACPPAPLDEWSAPAYRHAQARQPGSCSQALVADFYASCLGPAASNDGCNQSWGAGQDAAHQACQGCLVTASSAALWGPLVDYGTTVSVNVAGCVELLDPSALACAAAVQAADVCQHSACDPACPVSGVDASSFTDWEACVAATAQGECNAYLAAATCDGSGNGGGNGTADAGPAAACVAGKTFQDDFLTIGAIFCSSLGD